MEDYLYNLSNKFNNILEIRNGSLVLRATDYVIRSLANNEWFEKI